MVTKKPSLFIIDDEEKARDAIRSALRLMETDVTIIGEAGSVKEAVTLINENKPDIILLDIQLSDGTGFDVLSHLQSPVPQVIFITAFEQYALNAFRFSAVDYILKPIDPGHLKEAIDKAVNQLHSGAMEIQIRQLMQILTNPIKDAKKIVLKTSEHIHVVQVKDIIRLEADTNYTTFFLENGSHVLVSKTLKEFDELLNTFGFIRIHQSHLVNMDYITQFDKREGGFLILKDQTRIPVSTRKKEELLRFLDKL